MTAISEFYEPVRAFLGDHGPDIYMYEEDAIARTVRAVVRTGLAGDFALTSDNASITPAVEVNAFLLICLKTARMFVAPNPSRQSGRTRAYSESIGDFKDFMLHLEMQIHDLENGTMFASWQSFASFVEGFGGVAQPWRHLAQLKTVTPGVAISL